MCIATSWCTPGQDLNPLPIYLHAVSVRILYLQYKNKQNRFFDISLQVG